MKSDAAINELFGVACCRYAALSIASACVFGSTARNEARHDSVIDGFIDVAPGRKCSLINLVCLRRFLEAELGVSVDLTQHASLDPQLLSNIEREAVEAFRCLVASISFSRKLPPQFWGLRLLLQLSRLKRFVSNDFCCAVSSAISNLDPKLFGTFRMKSSTRGRRFLGQISRPSAV